MKSNLVIFLAAALPLTTRFITVKAITETGPLFIEVIHSANRRLLSSSEPRQGHAIKCVVTLHPDTLYFSSICFAAFNI